MSSITIHAKDQSNNSVDGVLVHLYKRDRVTLLYSAMTGADGRTTALTVDDTDYFAVLTKESAKWEPEEFTVSGDADHVVTGSVFTEVDDTPPATKRIFGFVYEGTAEPKVGASVFVERGGSKVELHTDTSGRWETDVEVGAEVVVSIPSKSYEKKFLVLESFAGATNIRDIRSLLGPQNTSVQGNTE